MKNNSDVKMGIYRKLWQLWQLLVIKTLLSRINTRFLMLPRILYGMATEHFSAGG